MQTTPEIEQEATGYVSGIVNFETLSLEEAMNILFRIGVIYGMADAAKRVTGIEVQNMQHPRLLARKAKDRIRAIVWSGE